MTTEQKTPAIGFNEHLQFFDGDADAGISLRETQRGLRRLGFGYLLTVPAAVGINVGIAGLGLVQGRRVNPANLALPRTGHVRHPDTVLVDDDGHFDDVRLDDVFALYGRSFDGDALTLAELARMTGTRVFADASGDLAGLLMFPAGLAATGIEWGALFWVAGTQREGRWVLEKATVRRFYTDATFFDEVARQVAARREQRAQTTLGRARNVLQTLLA